MNLPCADPWCPMNEDPCRYVMGKGTTHYYCNLLESDHSNEDHPFQSAREAIRGSARVANTPEKSPRKSKDGLALNRAYHVHIGLLTGAVVWLMGKPYHELECFDPGCPMRTS